MPTTTKRTRGNVGKSRNELEGKQLATDSESESILQLDYRSYKKNIITLESLKIHTNENNN